MNIFDHYRQRYEAAKDEEFTLQEFLTTCRQDRSAYANAAERLLMAIGEPVMVDTAQEPRLSRLFSNRVIARYPAFEEFYGMEDAIEQIVSYLKHAAQGLEEKKQILYLLGPVGGGKSSLAERLKSLMQLVPIYVLSANGVNPLACASASSISRTAGSITVAQACCPFSHRYGRENTDHMSLNAERSVAAHSVISMVPFPRPSKVAVLSPSWEDG